VRNKQIEIDQHRKREVAMDRYVINEKWKEKREKLRQIQENKKAEKESRKYPEKEVVKWLVNSRRVLKGMGRVPGVFVKNIKKYLNIILSKSDRKKYLERLKSEIMSLVEHDLEQRLDMIEHVSRWIEESRKVGVKSVTLF
jgi:hypothetical protein